VSGSHIAVGMPAGWKVAETEWRQARPQDNGAAAAGLPGIPTTDGQKSPTPLRNEIIGVC